MLHHLYDFFWVVTGMLHRAFVSYPQFRWPADRFGAVNMALIAVLRGSWPWVERRQGWALILAGMVGVVETLNGINHLAAVAAPFLLILGLVVLRELRRDRTQREIA